MASPDNEIMEIDSDEDSTPLPAKKSKNDHENKNIDDKKAIEIINLLMDEDSEDDVKSLKEGKEVGNVDGEMDVSPSKSESKIEKGDPAAKPTISDSKDDVEEEKEEVKETKEVYTPKKDGKTMQREGVTIRNVEEITQEKTKEKEMDDKEVITLEEDEEEKGVEEDLNSEIQANRRKCLNTGCKSGVDMQVCHESHIFTFYSLKPRPKQLVCKACRDTADNHFQELTSLLKQNKPIFSAKFPPRSDIVLLDDSDDEQEADSGGEEMELDEEVSNIINNNDLLDNFMKEVMGKFDIGEQEKQNVDFLKQEGAKMAETIKEYDERFSKVFTSLEKSLNAFYQIGVPEIVSVSPIEIIDVYEEPKVAPPLSTPKEGALSSAVILKKPLYTNRQPVAMKKVTQYGGQPTTSKARPSVTNEKDIVPLESALASMPPLPPYGALQKKKLAVGDNVFVIRSTLFKAWSLARVIELIQKPAYTEGDNQVRVVYDLYKKSPPTKVVTTKLCAYREQSPVRLPVGSRIIAVYRGEDEPVEKVVADDRQQFYSGVLAEAPKMSNKYRYLVFFDDGYTQYVHHANIRLVCETSAKVWDDVDPESRQFIKDYLTRYPERPMVKVQLHEIVKTEWNGRWWVARVQDIDGSLVKMHFDADDRTEWIYRGSTRLGPLYLEITAAKNRQTGRNRHASYLKRQAQYVEYTQNVDDNDNNSDDDVQIVEPTGSQTQAAPGGQGQVRSVARKSTANRAQPVLEGGDGGDIVYHRVGPIDASIKPKHFVLQNHPGQIVKVDMSSFPKPKQFVNHACGNHCVAWTGYTDVHSKEIPGLQRPLKFGFQRLFYTKKSKPFVAYIGPCGRRLRNMDEMVKYLFKTRSELACDFFDFDPWVSCVNQYKLHSVKTSIKDLSYGKENISIECVNYVDTTYPDFVYYQTERRAMENVNLNLDPEFLSGCDCTDNCQDRSKCACWQLTINGAKGVPGSDFDENSIGYQYRRLPERVVSGIYECNSQCKCSKTCMNRVVQFPISVKLQLYKTLMKGWGMRCLHDIPQGSFICIYAGNLLTEQAANEGGKTYGDEYLAELDFIEVLENLKDDYESDVTVLSDDEPQITENEDKKNRVKRSPKEKEEEEEEDVDDPEPVVEKRGGYEEDRTFSVSHRRLNTETDSSNMRARLRARETAKKSKDSESDRERKHSQFNAKIKESEKKEHKSVREYYDTDDCIYVMDAKNGGNIGRYMNHSCNPNCFVQNVFMDTHDLRFPWVAFFASRFIEAGHELTWDYNYDVGSVPGKVLYCYCGETNCRRRLL